MSSDNIEAVAVSYSEEQFDPPSSLKRRRVDENDHTEEQVPAGNEENCPGKEVSGDKRQQIHRPTGSYDDALLLASLSDEQADEKVPVSVNAPSGDSVEDNVIAAGTHAAVTRHGNATSAHTPRRSNATTVRTSKHNAPDNRGGFILHPKPTSQDTPENKSDTKKVTPDRLDSTARASASSHMKNPYPPARYPYYPPYGHLCYPPYYSTHRYPQPPPPVHAPPAGTTQPSPAGSAQPPAPLTEQRESHSPLPYHPLSHVVPHYEDHWGYYDQRYGYYPPPHQPPPPQPSHPTPSTHLSQTNSTSPARSVKPWVSMDENSPRVDYHIYHNQNSHVAPGTPSHPNQYHSAQPPSTPSHNQQYDYYGYDHYGLRQEYSTPPMAYNEGPPTWEEGVVQQSQLVQTHEVPQNPSTTPLCVDSDKKHQFRKGTRGMHSDPVVLRKKFSWRNYPEVSLILSRCFVFCFGPLISL